MSQLQDRIAQFRKMANDDPENELGHFRLGQLLLEAGEHRDAVQSFQRTLQLSPQFSKVYQLLGTSLLQLNQRAEAIETLRKGCEIAEERGDRMPREEMVKMLVSLGEAPPEAKIVETSGGVESGFRCQRPGCTAGKYARQLEAPPMKDEIGQRVFAAVCADCWNEWLKGFSIKVINEMRLDLSTEHGQAEYDRTMREFLGIE